MVSEDDVRDVALSLPGAVEQPYNHLPGFRVRGKLFARVHEQPDAIFVKCVDIAERDGLLDAEPEKFFITPHYSGYSGMLVRLSAIDHDELAELLTESWRLTAPKKLLAQLDAEPR
jgi:hypothetical protein